MKNINKNKFYKVEWRDITSKVWEEPKYLDKKIAHCWSIGKIIDGGKYVAVVYGGCDDDDCCFDIIPKANIDNIKEI